MATSLHPERRIVSLDQFRGYTVAGMFLVNFLSGVQVIPELFKHHGISCSYADTIMPQFFFAVGFAYRLTFLRSVERQGASAAYRRGLRRCGALILLGIVYHGLDPFGGSWQEMRTAGIGGFVTASLHGSMFQTLTHIGVTSLWILPVVGASPRVLLLFASGSGLLHLALSYLFYSDFAFHSGVIDGGPLGFLTWSIPMLAGALAHDALVKRGPHGVVKSFAGISMLAMMVGYGLSCLTNVEHTLAGNANPGLSAWLASPPFGAVPTEKDLWTMSQQAGSLSYQVFSAGFSLGVFLVCVILCDIGRVEYGVFRTLGQNPLAAYITEGLVRDCVAPFMPGDSPWWWALFMFGIFFSISYLFVRFLERHGLYLRL